MLTICLLFENIHLTSYNTNQMGDENDLQNENK